LPLGGGLAAERAGDFAAQISVNSAIVIIPRRAGRICCFHAHFWPVVKKYLIPMCNGHSHFRDYFSYSKTL
jgi:hypothetical protein